MYRERVNEQRKALGLSVEAVAERTSLHLSEETVSRFLSKSHDSRISTMLDICAAVNLEPYELFMDGITSAEFKLFQETKLSDIDNAAELEMLRAKTIAQEAEIRILSERVQSKDEIIRLYKIILDKG